MTITVPFTQMAVRPAALPASAERMLFGRLVQCGFTPCQALQLVAGARAGRPVRPADRAALVSAVRRLSYPSGLGAVSSSSAAACGTFSAAQIYQMALDAGFPPGATPFQGNAGTMTAIALKESGGQACALNSKPPDLSYGLYQINMYGNLGPARLVQFGLSSNTDLFDPVVNTAAAFTIWGGNDANLNIAWAISGVDMARYLAQMPAAAIAAASVGGGSGPAVSDDAGSSSGSASSSSFDLSSLGLPDISSIAAVFQDPSNFPVLLGLGALALWALA